MYGALRPRRSRVRKPRIMWNDPVTGPAEVVARKAFSSKDLPTAPPLYQPSREASQAVNDSLVIGGAVVTQYSMTPETEAFNRIGYPYPPLVRWEGNTPSRVPAGSLLMYAGGVRCTERKFVNGGVLDVRVIKHTFITPMGRCIVHDLSLLRGT